MSQTKEAIKACLSKIPDLYVEITGTILLNSHTVIIFMEEFYTIEETYSGEEEDEMLTLKITPKPQFADLLPSADIRENVKTWKANKMLAQHFSNYMQRRNLLKIRAYNQYLSKHRVYKLLTSLIESMYGKNTKKNEKRESSIRNRKFLL